MPAENLINLSINDLNLLIEKQMKDSIIAKVKEAFDKAASMYRNQTFIIPEIRFDLEGRVAGYACFNFHDNSKNYLRFNLVIAKMNIQEFLDRTPAHEVAHLVAYQLFGRGIKPHGWQWQMISDQLGAGSTRCHNYKVVKARKTSRYIFNCACGAKYNFGVNIRSKMESGRNYFCSKCRSSITLDKVIKAE